MYANSSYVAASQETAPEQTTQILLFVADTHVPDSRYESDYSARPYPPSKKGKQALMRMRYVNSTFRASATRLLFDVDVIASTTFMHLPCSWVSRTLELGQSLVAESVERLNVFFPERGRTDELIDALLHMGCVLPGLVNACKRLKTLGIRGEGYVLGEPPDPGDMFVVDLDESYTCLLKTLVLHLLGQLSVDTRPATFRAFEVELPLAYNYSQLLVMSKRLSYPTFVHHPVSRTPMLQSLTNLHHLGVTITRHSGSAHQRHPNAVYAARFWDFVRLAKMLRSLHVSCADTLDMDAMATDHLTSLRELKLRNIGISQLQLMNLLTRNKMTLRAINLSYVALKSGTWKLTLLRLCEFSYLDHFWMDSCGYDVNGSSRHFAPELGTPQSGSKDIKTCLDEDLSALGHVQRHVNRVRTAARLPLPVYGQSDYRRASLPPLEGMEEIEDLGQ